VKTTLLEPSTDRGMGASRTFTLRQARGSPSSPPVLARAVRRAALHCPHRLSVAPNEQPSAVVVRGLPNDRRRSSTGPESTSMTCGSRAASVTTFWPSLVPCSSTAATSKVRLRKVIGRDETVRGGARAARTTPPSLRRFGTPAGAACHHHYRTGMRSGHRGRHDDARAIGSSDTGLVLGELGLLPAQLPVQGLHLS
jgi:hypothetical protein